MMIQLVVTGDEGTTFSLLYDITSEKNNVKRVAGGSTKGTFLPMRHQLIET